MTTYDSLDHRCVDTLRTLAMDAVQRAKSGHPGTPMALSPVAYVLFTRILRHDPADPSWPDRDRFVLSCGHASMLLYGILHLTGYELSLDDLRAFRQWGSRTPGHPERQLTPGVETTTGPLGQGCANSVGLAVAEAHLAARFNRSAHPVVDHTTWALCSDGDLMEGVSSEAASIAGHLQLDKLVWIWDDNRITIEGGTDLTFSEDVPGRFRALGWHVETVEDANDLDQIQRALETARSTTGRPSLVRVRSHIAWGAPTKQDTAAAHGAPLGADEVRATKRAYGWPEDAELLVPEGVRERCDQRQRGASARASWLETLERWRTAEPELAAEWDRRERRQLASGWDAGLPHYVPGDKLATRAASGAVLQAISDTVPELIGGSADLAPSNKTELASTTDLTATDRGGRILRFGIREHAMAGISNGIALHGGLRPFAGTFFVFLDYLRPALRMAAIMELPVVLVLTHDSIGVGEDGATHQPIEQLAMLRATPGVTVIRPADAVETVGAWRIALAAETCPVALVLTRQKVPVLQGTRSDDRGVARGAYIVLPEPETAPVALVLLASGSEVALAVDVATALNHSGVSTRVVSFPCWELFAEQPARYREEVLGTGVPRLAIEAAASFGWERWLGSGDDIVALDRFGASAPAPELFTHFGFTVDAVCRRARALVGR
jgi:transketolase